MISILKSKFFRILIIIVLFYCIIVLIDDSFENSYSRISKIISGLIIFLGIILGTILFQKNKD